MANNYLKKKGGDPNWFTCPVCGQLVRHNTPTQVTCGSPKCQYAIRKWRQLAERIWRTNPSWFQNLERSFGKVN